MGGKGGAPLKVNTKRLDKKKKDSECFEELQALFTCMTRSGANFDSECAAQRRALAECADMAAKRRRAQKSTINFHLQRLSRALKMAK